MEPKIAAKSWNPDVERIIFKKWEEDDLFKFSISEQKQAFVIDTPPPYPSGSPWHIGVAAPLCANRYDCENGSNDEIQCHVSYRY